MIFVDIDGVLIDFIGTAKKFGVDLKPNEFDKWTWSADGYPTPEEFYAVAELQPYAVKLLNKVSTPYYKPIIVTNDFVSIKGNSLNRQFSVFDFSFIEKFNKADLCTYSLDFLIDDNAAECEAWREKGGIPWHFDLASETPFEDFLKFWRNKK